MADKLGTTYRISDRKYDKNGAKVEIWTKGRHKYIVHHLDPKGIKAPPTSTQYYIGDSKISASLTDDEVINQWLDSIKKQNDNFDKAGMPSYKSEVYTILQNPYQEIPPTKRKYGKTPYYLNDGSYILIKWFPYQDGKDESDLDDFNGVYKTVEIHPPQGAKLKEGEFYRHGSSFGLNYDTKVIESTKANYEREVVLINGRPYETVGPEKESKYGSTMTDERLVKNFISYIKSAISTKKGISFYDIKIELCKPDTESCKLIEFIDYLDLAPENTALPPAGLSASGTQSTAEPPVNNKTPLTIEGLEDGLEIKALTNLPEFVIWAGKKPDENNLGDDDLDYLREEGYVEGAFTAEEEEEIKFQLSNPFGETGESGGDDSSSSDTTSGSGSGSGSGGSSINPQAGNGVGIRRFQKTLTLNGKKVFNGEIPEEFLAKLDFCGLKLEKHAAAQLNKLNQEFKAKFGTNIAMSGGYRTFNTQNEIFDWPYYEANKKGRKKGTNGGTAAAKPGTSQHGWGLAVDTSGYGDKGNPKFDFLDSAGKKYDWINPGWAKGAGAGHEPWHFEYVGKDTFKNDVA